MEWVLVKERLASLPSVGFSIAEMFYNLCNMSVRVVNGLNRTVPERETRSIDVSYFK